MEYFVQDRRLTTKDFKILIDGKLQVSPKKYVLSRLKNIARFHRKRNLNSSTNTPIKKT